MEPWDLDWVQELQWQAENDMQYWQLVQQMRQLECQLEVLRQSLKPEEQTILDAYCLQQKRMEVSMTRMAYLIGCSHGKKAKQ